jgi:hypothetical protein
MGSSDSQLFFSGLSFDEIGEFVFVVIQHGFLGQNGDPCLTVFFPQDVCRVISGRTVPDDHVMIVR